MEQIKEVMSAWAAIEKARKDQMEITAQFEDLLTILEAGDIEAAKEWARAAIKLLKVGKHL